MGFVFRKSFKVAPGVRFNVNKRGMGVSVGARNGPRVTVNSSGRVTKSVRLAPGLRWQETSTIGKRKARKPATRSTDLPQAQEIQELITTNPQAINQNFEDIEPRNLFLPHSIWSVLFFAIGGFISATQDAYDKLAFFIMAMAVIFLITYIWNLKNRDLELEE